MVFEDFSGYTSEGAVMNIESREVGFIGFGAIEYKPPFHESNGGFRDVGFFAYVIREIM